MKRKSDNVDSPGFTDETRFIGKGCECLVYEIVRLKLVCKVYAFDADAKYNYTIQRIAFRAGIAPEPMGLKITTIFQDTLNPGIKQKKTTGNHFTS